MAGEKSTNYMESSVAAERLAQALPTAKLLHVARTNIPSIFPFPFYANEQAGRP